MEARRHVGWDQVERLKKRKHVSLSNNNGKCRFSPTEIVSQRKQGAGLKTYRSVILVKIYCTQFLYRSLSDSDDTTLCR